VVGYLHTLMSVSFVLFSAVQSALTLCNWVLLLDSRHKSLSAGVTLVKQVAQLWHRDRAKLETFSINVQRYSKNHAQNCIFGPPYVRIGRNVCGLFESLTQRNFIAEFH